MNDSIHIVLPGNGLENDGVFKNLVREVRDSIACDVMVHPTPQSYERWRLEHSEDDVLPEHSVPKPRKRPTMTFGWRNPTLSHREFAALEQSSGSGSEH